MTRLFLFNYNKNGSLHIKSQTKKIQKTNRIRILQISKQFQRIRLFENDNSKIDRKFNYRNLNQSEFRNQMYNLSWNLATDQEFKANFEAKIKFLLEFSYRNVIQSKLSKQNKIWPFEGPANRLYNLTGVTYVQNVVVWQWGKCQKSARKALKKVQQKCDKFWRPMQLPIVMRDAFELKWNQTFENTLSEARHNNRRQF